MSGDMTVSRVDSGTCLENLNVFPSYVRFRSRDLVFLFRELLMV